MYKNDRYKKRSAPDLSYDFKFPLPMKQNVNNPQNIPQQQSISRSILFTSKNSLPTILSKEFNDISQDLNAKLINTIYNTRRANIDHDKYRRTHCYQEKSIKRWKA